MKLTHIKINNFRGIRDSLVCFPLSENIICLIGPGDSGKSTLLRAIEWVLWPSWNLIVTDTDFYECDTSKSIEITASFAELPNVLLKEDKYGLYLRDLKKSYNSSSDFYDDEPTDDGITILTIRLTVDNSLEPKWEVVCGHNEPKTISHNDRRLLSLGVVGMDSDKDFQWGRGSVLQKYTNSHDALHNAFTQAMRSAAQNTDLNDLDEATSCKLEEIGGKYGVSFKGSLHNKLLIQNSSYSTTVGVFDDKVPFNQRGLGSKRLLSIGMNVEAYTDGTLVLVDEIETGLEPYRISGLINEFRSQFKNRGQLIMTTHSRSAVCECTVSEICICNNTDGEFSVRRLNQKNEIKADMQRLLRANPDAFLSKRVIVCEGKTEVGILRAFDNYLIENKSCRFAHYGVGVVPGGGGNNFFELAKLLCVCGYDVAILMDSDLSDEEPKKAEVRNLGIPIFDWENGFAIEEQLFNDISLNCIDALLQIAIREKSYDHVKNKLNFSFQGKRCPVQFDDAAESANVCDDITNDERVLIGSIAKNKKCEWYKNTSVGEEIGNQIFKEFDSMHDCRFHEQMTALYHWVDSHEK